MRLCSAGRHFCDLGRNVPWQQLLDTIDWMFRDAGQHIPQVALRINSIKFGRADQAVDRRGTLPTSVGSGEEIVLSAKSYGAQCSFRSVVVDLQSTIVAVAHQRFPSS